MIIQYGKRAGGKIWSTTAARKASARIIRKSQGPVAARRFRSLKSRQRKRKRSIAKVAVKPTLVTTCLSIKADLDPDGGHARTKTVQSKARQINEVVYLEIQFLPLLFALQLKMQLLKIIAVLVTYISVSPAPVRASLSPLTTPKIEFSFT